MIPRFYMFCFLLWLPVTLPTSALAQQSPTPSAAVIAEARRVAQVTSGQVITASPDTATRTIDPYTGHGIWRLNWEGPTIEIDEITLSVREYNDDAAYADIMRRYQTGEAPSLNVQQVTTIFQQLRTRLNLPNGDWRTKTPILRSANRPGPARWFILQVRYEAGRPVMLAGFDATVETYTGKILNWRYDNRGIVVPPQGAILTKPQAQGLAESAFQQYMGSALRPEDPRTPVAGGSGAWYPVANGTTLSRLMYRFIFRLPEVPGSTGEEPLRGEQEYWVDVDAETGEVNSIAQVLASISAPQRSGLRVAPRVLLRNRLAAANAPMPLLLAVTGGKPEKAFTATTPPKNNRRFTYPVNDRKIDFALDSSKRVLRVEREPKRWLVLHLSRSQTDGLSRWLTSRKK